MADVLKLDVICKEIPVVLYDPNKKTEKEYKLKELIGRDRNKYLNKMKARTKVGKNGTLTISTFDGFQADLLKISLFDDTGEPVSEEFIEDLPSSAQTTLFEKSQKLSGLDVEKEDEEKNE